MSIDLFIQLTYNAVIIPQFSEFGNELSLFMGSRL